MSFKLVEQAIDCYLRSSELKNCIVSYDDEDGNKEQNFLSTVKKVTLTGYKNSDVPIVMKVFVKTLTESEERNERLKLRIKFSREAFVYNEIVPIFEVIQKDLDEPEKLYFPKCHSASEAYLILEDISNSGFKDIDHFKPVDDITHMVMMVQNIARWHSLSFVLKQKEPLKFTRLTESLDTIFVTKDRAEFVYGNSWNKALAIISNEGIKTYLSNIKDEMIQRSISLPHPGEIGVVCHGDINLRNALFKYDEVCQFFVIILFDSLF